MTRSFEEMASDMDASLIDQFSTDCIVNGDRVIQAVIDRDVQQFGAFDTNGPVTRHEISFIPSTFPEAARGITVKAKGVNYVLDGIISSDGSMARWYLNED